MSLLKKLEFYIVDPTTGLPVSGADVEVRKQGATVSGITDVNNFDINEPGGALTSPVDTVRPYQPGGAIREDTDLTVVAVTGTTMQVGGGGFAAVLDDDRLSIISALPTVYEDRKGAESKGNPLSTDANGYAYCWIPGNFYDVMVEKTGVLTERLLIDQASIGVGLEESWAFGGAAAIPFERDTKRTLQTTDVLEQVSHDGSIIFKRFADGKTEVAERIKVLAGGILVDAGGITTTAGGHTINSGGLTLGVSGGVINQNEVSLTPNVMKSPLRLLSKDLQVRHIVADQGPAFTTGDITLGAGWGSGPAVTSVTNANNTAGRVRITTGTGPSGNAAFTINLNPTFSGSSPHVLVCRAGGTISVGTSVGMVSHISPSATQIVVQVVGNLAASTAYDYEWILLAR